MTSFDFRVRATLGNSVKIDSPEVELPLATGNVTVSIRSLNDELLTDARVIKIVGRGYASAEEALAEGERWRAAVTVGFARVGLGADFRERAPGGGLTTAFLEEVMAAHPEVQLYNEEPGVLVYPSEPQALFAHAEATGVVGKRGAQVTSVVQEARQRNIELSDRHRLAYDLWSASFFLSVADARFMMLSMALETLIEQLDRPLAVQEQLAALIEQANASDLEDADKQTLVGGLRALRQESVGQAGRRLAETLDGRTYQDMPAVRFFSYCYALRSRLVHGAYPRPTREEVDLAAAHLERFVGDLLATDLLDLDI